MTLVNADSSARAGVTHTLQQLGRDRIDLMKQLAAAPAAAPSCDTASDFQVIESHWHAVVARAEEGRAEEGRLRGEVQARKSRSKVEEEPWVAEVGGGGGRVMMCGG